METITAVTAIVGAVTGMLGACLGIYSTWTLFLDRRVRLRVVPKVAFDVGRASVVVHEVTGGADRYLRENYAWRLCVEVVNLSRFAVTVNDAGFGRAVDERAPIIPSKIAPENVTWPARLESRQAVTVYAGIRIDIPVVQAREKCAYAKTDCDHTSYGKSKMFSHYVDWLIARCSK